MWCFRLVAALAVIYGASSELGLAQQLRDKTALPEQSERQATGSRQIVTINLAFKDGQFYLGEIPTQLSEESVEAVDQESLVKLASPILKSDVLQTVSALRVKGGFISLKELKRGRPSL